jgi:acyl-coenzyme A synthetase/AMP-(fatty) acid ligase
MARTDAEGRIWIVGRAKDMILEGAKYLSLERKN